ncbi:hypothetical protein PSECIP111854_02791 [Pseudoalteromonas sp. CIP111854]|uniref:Short-chain dehydrogenase n=1 Tax=Pseudoalteromonas holothuriae TaxID=2963714 RepID=A0A9W4R0F4_9GAMM|nr:SDR family oxidoreductase [Pseudoalteromonas sp. CIP111854]CAH9061340.1 hypothetical protein PSECIP111854_02791 [Pseudoalteromonas sp. CIP111854]
MTDNTIIIIGAGGSIANAFLREQHNRFPAHNLITISRNVHDKIADNHQHFQCDNSEQQIQAVTQSLSTVVKTAQSITVFNGQLHNEAFSPEKRLEDINEHYLSWILKANTITPMLWLKYIGQRLGPKSRCVITFLSARVASIDDNELGGWYAYRASKAALNMAVKTASIELARRAKYCKCVLFHPGTTDTNLSKPFQKNVPEGKLFTPNFVAQQLSTLITTRDINGQVDYIDWQGKAINW